MFRNRMTHLNSWLLGNTPNSPKHGDIYHNISKKNSLTRRSFLQLSAGVATVGLFPQIAWAAPIHQDSEFVPDVELLLRAKVEKHPIFSGAETWVWWYEGEVIEGDATNLIPIDGSFLGPSIHVRTGQKVRIRFQNELPEALTSTGMVCMFPRWLTGILVLWPNRARNTFMSLK
jgi:hypothetical protein